MFVTTCVVLKPDVRRFTHNPLSPVSLFVLSLICSFHMRLQTIKSLLLVFLTCLTTVQVTVMRYSRIVSSTKYYSNLPFILDILSPLQ